MKPGGPGTVKEKAEIGGEFRSPLGPEILDDPAFGVIVAVVEGRAVAEHEVRHPVAGVFPLPGPRGPIDAAMRPSLS